MNNEKKYAFIFAVCGTDEHIDTLNFSLVPLSKRTKYPIYIVTDTSRNTLKINWDKIIDIQTPKEYNNHQAAIYLKTGLHLFLPNDGTTYCYLDTDIIAIGNYVDAIFEEFSAPINFARDHCKMRAFSPIAVKCNCQNKTIDYERKITEQLNSADEYRLVEDVVVRKARQQFEENYKSFKSRVKLRLKIWLQLLLPLKIIKIDANTLFNRKTQLFTTADGIAFMRNFNFFKLLKKAGYRWSWIKKLPTLPNGESVYGIECNHLNEAINKTFNIQVKDKNFSHYNGGMFLFNQTSHEFLNFWHNSTLRIFSESFWKTRDQGTLIATVHKFGIEKRKPMNSRWNLIIDYNNPNLDIDTIVKEHYKNNPNSAPQFLHVYHHFKDRDWYVWNEIEKIM